MAGQQFPSECWSAGFVWSPIAWNGSTMSERFDIAATYYQHEIEGAIQAIDAQTQLDLCVATLDPLYCDVIVQRWEKFTGKKAERINAAGKTVSR